MDFGYVIVYVPDVVAAIEFYEQAFGLKRRMVHESGQYAELETGTTLLAFASPAMAEENNLTVRVQQPHEDAAGTEIVFVTADVQTAFDHAVNLGAIPIKTPAVMPWGQTVSYVRDPNGILIELCNPVRAENL